MQAPSFWNIKHGRDSAPMIRLLLTPFSWIYSYFTQKRIKETIPQNLTAKVISIGNISLGGTGKTPIARHIRALLPNAAIVSRGYGGSVKDPLRIEFENMNAKMCGDEPYMLSQDGAVFIGEDRLAAAKLAIENGFRTLILDDAHQNPNIHKDLSIVVVDGAVGFGNERIVPAGPLREKIETGLSRADAIIWIGDRHNASDSLNGFQKPILYANLVPTPNILSGRYIGFCGIGRPEKFHDTLTSLGADVVDFLPFPDHHFYTPKQLGDLAAIAKHSKAKLITTEKDFVRLPKDFAQSVDIVNIEIAFEDNGALLALLGKINAS